MSQICLLVKGARNSPLSRRGQGPAPSLQPVRHRPCCIRPLHLPLSLFSRFLPDSLTPSPTPFVAGVSHHFFVLSLHFILFFSHNYFLLCTSPSFVNVRVVSSSPRFSESNNVCPAVNHLAHSMTMAFHNTDSPHHGIVIPVTHTAHVSQQASPSTP